VRAEAFERESGPIALRLATGLAKVGLAFRHEAWHHSFARGLSPTQAQVLASLRRRTPSTLQDLALDLGVGTATLSEAVTALVRKGLVRKDRQAADRRALALSLTPAGRREAERVALWPDLLREALEELPPEDQAALLRAVVRAILALQRKGRIPVARMCATCRFFRPNVHDDPERPHHCALVDALFGDRSVRLDCPDHQLAAVPVDADRNPALLASPDGEQPAETHAKSEGPGQPPRRRVRCDPRAWSGVTLRPGPV
jgi:DNA-binding MarR family transcriptional regulator